MNSNKLQKTLRKKSNAGFTITEALIVLVIIGILVGISILGYGQWKRQATESAVKSDLNGVASAMEDSRTFENGYPSEFPTTVKASNGVTLQYMYGDDTTYCAEGSSVEFSDIRYFINTAIMVNQPTKGTCEGGVLGGNIATDDGPWLSLAHGTGSHTCARHENSKIYCWGMNLSGQLGVGDTATRDVPTPINDGLFDSTKINAFATGLGHSCAIADYKAYCWGRNDQGQIGDNSLTNRNSPVAVNTSGVLSGKAVTKIAGGADHTCALADQQVYCWGDNTYGQLGNANMPTDSSVPVAVSVTGVLAGKTISQLYAGHYHNCVLAEGAVYCWGANSYGQLGNGSAGTHSSIPTAVVSSGVLAGKTISNLEKGSSSHTCVVASAKAYCWGQNDYGQLGNGMSGAGADSSVPVAVDDTGVLSGQTVSAVTTGSYYSCALADYKQYCWGRNQYGRLGNGTTTDSYVPIAVSTAGVLNGKLVRDMTGGYDGKACSITFGQVFCWGNGSYGRLGNDTSVTSYVPVTVTNP